MNWCNFIFYTHMYFHTYSYFLIILKSIFIQDKNLHVLFLHEVLTHIYNIYRALKLYLNHSGVFLVKNKFCLKNKVNVASFCLFFYGTESVLEKLLGSCDLSLFV